MKRMYDHWSFKLAAGIFVVAVLADVLRVGYPPRSSFVDEFADMPYEPQGGGGTGIVSWTGIAIFGFIVFLICGYHMNEWLEERRRKKQPRHVTTRPWSLSQFPHEWLSDAYEVCDEHGHRCGKITIWDLAGRHASGTLTDQASVYLPPKDSWMTLEAFRQHMHEAVLKHEQRQPKPAPDWAG